MRLKRWHSSLVVCAALVLVVEVHLGAQEQPVFRAEVDVVQIDVAVVDDQGSPIRGLTVEDFTLLVDGKARPITFLEFVSYASDVEAGAGSAVPEAAPYFSTNEGAARGRLALLMVDRGTIPRGEGRAAMASAAAFVDSLSPADRVGVFTAPQRETLVPFTSDRARVKQALNGITGLATSVSGNFGIGLVEAMAIAEGEQATLASVGARECTQGPEKPMCERELVQEARAIAQDALRRTRELFASLAYELEALKKIQGPKSLILISGGFVLDNDTRGLLEQLAWSAATAGVSLYAVQLETPETGPSRFRPSPTRLRDSSLLADGVGSLAGMMRGSMVRISRSGQPAFSRIERELEGHYLLGFETALSDRDGKPHEVAVRISRDDAIVRSRTAFIVSRELRPPSDNDLLKGVLANPLSATELTLKVSTYNVRDPATAGPQLLVAAEIGTEATPAKQASLAFVLLDEEGTGVVGKMERISRSPSAAGQPSPLRYAAAVPAPFGDYTLRMAAIDDQGRIGSLEHPVQLRLASLEEMELSDLLISDPGGGGLGAPLVWDMAAKRGHFDLTLEIYTKDESPPQNLAVSFELAKNEEAPRIVAADAQVTSAEEPGRWTASGQIDVQSLSPDDYVARAVVNMEGRAPVRISRPFHLVREEARDTQPTNAQVAPPSSAQVDLQSVLAEVPTDYSKSLSDYQKSPVNAVRAVSKMTPNALTATNEQLQALQLRDPQLSLIALLHTEVALRTGRNELQHLGIARGLLERIENPSLKKTLTKDWLLLMGYHLHGLYRDRDALSFLDAALDMFPNDTELLMALGTVHEAPAWMFGNRDSIDRAEDIYRKILKADRDNVEAHLRLGHVLKMKEKPKDSLRELEWCLSHSDEADIELVAHLLMGDLQQQANQLVEAARSYRAALDIDRGCQVAAAAISQVLHESGDMAASREVWERFSEAFSEEEDGWLRYLHGSPELIDAMLTKMRGEIQ